MQPECWWVDHCNLLYMVRPVSHWMLSNSKCEVKRITTSHTKWMLSDSQSEMKQMTTSHTKWLNLHMRYGISEGQQSQCVLLISQLSLKLRQLSNHSWYCWRENHAEIRNVCANGWTTATYCTCGHTSISLNAVEVWDETDCNLSNGVA